MASALVVVIAPLWLTRRGGDGGRWGWARLFGPIVLLGLGVAAVLPLAVDSLPGEAWASGEPTWEALRRAEAPVSQASSWR